MRIIAANLINLESFLKNQKKGYHFTVNINQEQKNEKYVPLLIFFLNPPLTSFKGYLWKLKIFFRLIRLTAMILKFTFQLSWFFQSDNLVPLVELTVGEFSTGNFPQEIFQSPLSLTYKNTY